MYRERSPLPQGSCTCPWGEGIRARLSQWVGTDRALARAAGKTKSFLPLGLGLPWARDCHGGCRLPWKGQGAHAVGTRGLQRISLSPLASCVI